MTEAEPSLSPHRHPQFVTTNIYNCFMPCKECTGNYVSELLQKRFLCHCRCHNTAKSDFGSATIRLRETVVS
jgi:hypothetical protein